ncbi:hypothetical protein K2173_009866 [Erythroxylum novogranatense]|uniref:Pollen Ole e 1 allergen and extensin family protein n=1 Tax=Erythroxylum novogranatense TaxID=1862640 RepID=A0AAV8T0I9_9ROSI|nr:hypothetical protein K2173_009866 [Erythroxylum novogranatense]
MAYASVFITTLLFLATASIAHAFSVNGIPIAQVIIPGRLYCAVGGNPASGAKGLARVGVFLSCDGGKTSLAQVVTNTNGLFQIVLAVLDGVAFDPSFCAIYVQLPVARCAVLPHTGCLQASISVTGVVPSTLGFAANVTPGLFSVVSP